jgi:hypothetical protein
MRKIHICSPEARPESDTHIHGSQWSNVYERQAPTNQRASSVPAVRSNRWWEHLVGSGPSRQMREAEWENEVLRSIGDVNHFPLLGFPGWVAHTGWMKWMRPVPPATNRVSEFDTVLRRLPTRYNMIGQAQTCLYDIILRAAYMHRPPADRKSA